MKSIFTPLIPAIRKCGWYVTLSAQHHAVIHHLSPHSKKNIALRFFLDRDNKFCFCNCIESRYRGTVSHMTSASPEYRHVNNKGDILDALIVLIRTGLLKRIGASIGQEDGAGRINVPFVVNQFYKGGLNDKELKEMSNDIYLKAAAIAASIQ